jgi:uncharacterized membrane protein YhaH (DUF805 family)
MAFIYFLFSFNGRIGRLAYGVGTSIPLLLGTFIAITMIDFDPIIEALKMGRKPEVSQSLLWFWAMFYVVSFVSVTALGAKRLHDLNSSGWMLLAPLLVSAAAGCLMTISAPIGFLAMFGASGYSMYQMVRLIFFSGTAGDNDFGPPGQVLRDLSGGKVAVSEAEPDWVANAVKRTTAKAQATANVATAHTPVTRVTRVAKMAPSSSPAAPTGFGRRTRPA